MLLRLLNQILPAVFFLPEAHTVDRSIVCAQNHQRMSEGCPKSVRRVSEECPKSVRNGGHHATDGEASGLSLSYL